VATRTIAFHKYRIMQDFGLGNNSDLVRFAMKQGLINQS
jgi:DNA-binding CsgD family transcriptional regulator